MIRPITPSGFLKKFFTATFPGERIASSFRSSFSLEGSGPAPTFEFGLFRFSLISVSNLSSSGILLSFSRFGTSFAKVNPARKYDFKNLVYDFNDLLKVLFILKPLKLPILLLDLLMHRLYPLSSCLKVSVRHKTLIKLKLHYSLGQ